MTAQAQFAPPWLVLGDMGVTLARLHAEAPNLGPIDRIVALWWARRQIGSGVLNPDQLALARAIAVLLDAPRSIPPEPNVAVLRAWIREVGQCLPRGTMAEVSRAAGLSGHSANKVLNGKTIFPDRRYRLAAAIVAMGRGWIEFKGAPNK